MAGRIVVVGLGPGGMECLSVGTRAVIERVPRRFLRTARHPSAAAVPDAVSFDRIYDRESALEDVYQAIVEELVTAARDGDALYAVPGSPLVAERTVDLLRVDPRVEVEVLPAMSFLDLVWGVLGVDPLTSGVRL